ncbi:MAG: hypothetical protein M3362_12705 [Acidobacteriota bacterium]|nr:hypothetical protein [Acidobacteriota bacterium]
MQKKNSTKKRRRGGGFYETARNLAAFFSGEYPEDEETTNRLMEMAAWMIRYTPKGGRLAEEIYRAIGRAWDAARDEYCDEDGNLNMEHKTERRIVELHSSLINDFTRDRGGWPWEEASTLVDDTISETPRSTNAARSDESSEKLEELQRRLEKTEFLPENEAVRFQLMTEIHRLENKPDEDGWPDEIDG